MTPWLSDAWFERVLALASSLPARPGLSGGIQQQVSGGPDGDVSWYWVLVDGRPTAASVGTLDSPDVTLSLSWGDATAIQTGALDPSVAFMQGRMKVAGSMALVLELLPASRDPELEALRRQVRELTDW